MIYTDGTHLVTDGPLEELHEFAESIGLRREWFQDHRHPHYDLMGAKKKLAIERGAKVVSSKEIVRLNNQKGEMSETCPNRVLYTAD